ncbi:TPA: phage protein NinX family protein [Escherichia coli]|nr:DUF2591 family protein [Escherichia coli]MDD8565893.1 DUF2591 family protein [Escherichia coli]
MDYSQLSDFEINRMVGDIIFKGLWASKPETSGNNTNKWYYGNADTTFEPLNHLPDYCNDPSASWPIIEKYRISILDQLTEWCVDAKGVSASSSACHGLLIITAITPLPTKPSATKMPEN